LLGLDIPDEIGPARPGLPLAEIMPNVLTSALFAAFHAQQWPSPLPLFLLSLALGTLYRRTGSLVGPIAMHAAFNGLSTLMLFLKVRS